LTSPDVPWRVPSPNPTDNAIGGNVTNTVEELARKKQVMNLVKENSETIPKSKRKEKNIFLLLLHCHSFFIFPVMNRFLIEN
jgi:hypothetical protein